VLLPSLGARQTRASFATRVRRGLLFFAGSGVAFGLLLAAGDGRLIGWLYAGRYLEYAHLLWLLSLVAIAAAITSVLGTALRALECPQDVFWVYAVASLLAVAVGVPLVFAFQMPGAIIGMVLTSVTTAIAMVIAFRRRLAQSGRDWAA